MRLGAGTPSFHINFRLYFTGILDKEQPHLVRRWFSQ